MYHSWFYNKIENLSNDEKKIQYIVDYLKHKMFMKRNDPDIIKSCVDRGIPFNRIEERLFLHGFVSRNNDTARDEQAGYCSFYMIGYTKDLKELFYHIIYLQIMMIWWK